MKCRECGSPSKSRLCPDCRYNNRLGVRQGAIGLKHFSARIVKDLKTHDVTVPKKIIRTVSKQRKGVYVWGKVGTGKTLYACQLMLEVAALWEPPQHSYHFTTALDLLNEAREDFGKGEIIKHCCNVDLLILDDIGVEKITEWAAQTIDGLVNSRYEAMLPTLFTSNVDLNGLHNLYGARVASRISGMCQIVHFEENDKRLENRQ